MGTMGGASRILGSALRFVRLAIRRAWTCGPAVLCVAFCLIMTACSTAKKDVQLHGVVFQKAKIDSQGFVIGYIKADATIAGRPCKKGWVHLHPNGVLAGFAASQDIQLSRFVIPSNTWVFQDINGNVSVCAFPHDTEIQGHLCRGGWGGSEGVQTAFYPEGALKQFFTRSPVMIDGVPCAASLFKAGVELHENGKLQSATLSQGFVCQGRVYKRGDRIRLTQKGEPCE